MGSLKKESPATASVTGERGVTCVRELVVVVVFLEDAWQYRGTLGADCIERVWIELADPIASPPSVVPRSVFERLVSLDGPPKREAVPVRDMPGVTGRRIVHSDGSRVERNLRAVTEPYQTAEGDVCLHVCAELDWYRWGWSGKSPRTREIPIYQLWVE